MPLSYWFWLFVVLGVLGVLGGGVPALKAQQPYFNVGAGLFALIAIILLGIEVFGSVVK